MAALCVNQFHIELSECYISGFMFCVHYGGSAGREISKEEGDKPLMPSSMVAWTVVVEYARLHCSTAS